MKILYLLPPLILLVFIVVMSWIVFNLVAFIWAILGLVLGG